MIAVVLGHRLSAQGAVNTREVSEYRWNSQLARDVVERLVEAGVDAEVWERPNHRGGLGELVEVLNAAGVEAIVSLHFNSLRGSPATGTETLCHPRSAAGMDLAAAVQFEMVKALGLPDRGVKPTTVNGAGTELIMITRTRAPAVIVESHFGSNHRDVEVATAALTSGELGKAVAAGVVTWIGRPR